MLMGDSSSGTEAEILRGTRERPFEAPLEVLLEERRGCDGSDVA
jgi:hypothetical protein